MRRKLDLKLDVGLTMDKEFGPFPDHESAVKWVVQRMEERGNFPKDSWVAECLTPKEVSRRVKLERTKGSTMVSVAGYDNKLPDKDIKIAIANHFSSCGEVVDFSFYPFATPKSDPGRSITIRILGEDAKEKALQLNGSELGGHKLVVSVPFDPMVPQGPLRAGYGLPESARRQLALLEEQKKARPEEQCAQKIMRKQLMNMKDSWVAKSLTAKEVACSIMVCVRGFDNKLPDTDIKYAMVNHFSSCGEVVDFRFSPLGAPKSHPDKFVTIYILGQDAKEKAEQLNGSDLGGCKLVVTVPGFNTTAEERPMALGYAPPESTIRHLAFLDEQRKARREEHEYRCAQKIMKKQLMKEKEALRNQTKLNEANEL